MPYRKNVARTRALLPALFLLPAFAYACSVPVFQYALERWPADPYWVEVEHDKPLTEAQQAVVELLKAASDNEDSPINMIVRVTQPKEEEEQKTEAKTEAEDAEKQPQKKEGEAPPDDPGIPLPRINVYFPRMGPQLIRAWSGPVTKDTAEKIIDSPVRAEVGKRLTDRHSAVWVFVASGNKEKDEKAFEEMTQHLKTLQDQLKVPDDPPEELAGTVPTQDGPAPAVIFSHLKLDRNDPKEEFFIASLLKTEPDLHEFNDPMAFPIFGRGRCLYALVGEGINEDNIAEGCEFLVGACSCQVKAMNPGVDMLMRVPWDAKLMEYYYEQEDQEEEEPPTLTGVMPDAVDATDEDATLAAAAVDGADDGTTPSPEGIAPTEAAAVPVAQAAPKDNLGAKVFLALATVALLVIVGGTLAVSRSGKDGD